MDKKTAKRVHLVYGCITTVLIIILAISLMLSSWSIYQSGGHPYTRASVGEKLQNLLILITVTGCAIIDGFLLHLLVPVERTKPKAIRDERAIRNKLAAKCGNPTYIPAVNREKTLQLILPIATAVLYAGLMVYPALYLFDSANFPSIDPTAEIMKASLIALPPALVGLALCYVCSLLVRASINRQIDAYKQFLAANKGQGSAAAVMPERKIPLNIIRFAGLTVAIIFIVMGIFNGSAEDVLTKAIKICTECIGLG